jgi:hypothetical protein
VPRGCLAGTDFLYEEILFVVTGIVIISAFTVAVMQAAQPKSDRSLQSISSDVGFHIYEPESENFSIVDDSITVYPGDIVEYRVLSSYTAHQVIVIEKASSTRRRILFY